MDQNLVYAKTPNGDDAVRQSTRVVQRNLRLVLVQVDGKTTVAELGAKVGNAKLVESALRELEEGGFIAPVLDAPSVWERGKEVAKDLKEAAASQFSTFGPKSVRPADSDVSSISAVSAFSDFGGPLSPPVIPDERPAKASVGERMAAMFARDDRVLAETGLPPGRVRTPGVVRFFLGLIALLCLGVVFYPYNNFKPEIEAALGRNFHLPVRIGNVAVGFLPRPALTLQNVKIGAKEEIRIDEVRVPSLFSLLGGQRQIPDVAISGLAMPADAFGGLAGVGGDPAAGFAIGHARLKQMTIRVADIALRDLEGDISFAADGKPDKVSLQTADRTLRIEAVPTAQGSMLNIEGLGWKPMESYVFDSIQAKGLLQPGRLVLNNIDAGFMGGALKGNWLLNWGDGMAMAGEASLIRMNVRRVVDAFDTSLKIDGDLSGALRLRGTGKDWQSMWADVEASLDADIMRGVLTGVDLGEAARRGVGRGVRGGATKFERLRGVIVIEPQQVMGRDIRMEAGLISANGRFVADRERKVEGVFDVSIGGSVSSLRMPIKVSGTLPDLVVAADR